MHKWNALMPGIRAPQISLYNLVEWKDNGRNILKGVSKNHAKLPTHDQRISSANNKSKSKVTAFAQLDKIAY